MKSAVKKVLLAFSGGIDSCTAAEILLSEGYGVTALTLDMTGDGAMVSAARTRAAEAGIPIICKDVEQEFTRHVKRYFTDEYMNGRTPAPCTVCNAEIKWKFLYETAVDNGFDRIASGHYFRLEERNGYLYVARGADNVKDQSYYLWMLPQHILKMTLTPMGNIRKNDIPDLKRGKAGYRESLGICFLGGMDYADYIRKEVPEDLIREGDIVDAKGDPAGRHMGIPFYTIGQKKNLNTSGGHCVTAIDAASNRITAGYETELWHHNLIVDNCLMVDQDEISRSHDIGVKIRGFGKNPQGFAGVILNGDRMYVKLENPAWAPAPGQPVVLYRGERVVGGGFLTMSF